MKKFIISFAVAAICATAAQAQNSTGIESQSGAPQTRPERMQRSNESRVQAVESREGRIENRMERRDERREEMRDARQDGRRDNKRDDVRQERMENRQEMRQERREMIKAMPQEQRQEVRQKIKQENQRHHEEVQKILPVGSNANSPQKPAAKPVN